MATERQKKAIELMMTAKKKISVRKAMLKAGYSPASAHVNSIKKTGAWLDVLNKGLNDGFLLKRHKYLLEKNDGASIARGLDMAYKLKKYYGEDNGTGGVVNVQIMSYADKVKGMATAVPDTLPEVRESTYEAIGDDIRDAD